MLDKNFTENKKCEPQNSRRAVARRILAADGNTIRLSVLTLFCILVGMVVMISSSWLLTVMFSGVFVELPLVLGVVAMLALAVLVGGFVFLFLPCITGVVIFARRTVRGEKPPLLTVLEPFTSKNKKRYVNSILMPTAILLRMAIIFLPLVGGILNLPFVRGDASGMSFINVVSSSAFVLALSALALAVGMYVSSYFFFVPYLLIEEKTGFFAAFSVSVRMARQRKTEITKEMASQVPAVILSVLSLMVLWVVWAAPRMLVSYFVYCDSVAGLDNE